MFGLSNDEFALLIMCLNHTYIRSDDGVHKYLAKATLASASSNSYIDKY